MACAAYEQLRKGFEVEREGWLYFVSPNCARRHGSERIDTLGRMEEVRRQMFVHRQFCAECNRPAVAIAPKVKSAKSGGTH
jgi:hypothetical protein